MNYEVRPYQEKDKQKIIELILSIQQQEFNVAITAADQPDLSSIATFYQKGKGNFWVAHGGETIVGTIGLIDIDHNLCVLRKMFVHKDHRGKEKGVAQLLLTSLLNACVQNGITEVWLGTIDKMQAAHKFYIKNYFKEVEKSELPEGFPVMKVDNKFFKLNIQTDLLIYHVITASQWNDFSGIDFYEAESLKIEGFIHCSKANQVQGVLERYYANQVGLKLLHINPLLLTSELKWEVATHDELFPHVFGRIAKVAIVKIENLN